MKKEERERGAMLFHFTPCGGYKWKITCPWSHWLVLTLVYSYLQSLETSSLNTHTYTSTAASRRQKLVSKGENANLCVIQDSCLC